MISKIIDKAKKPLSPHTTKATATSQQDDNDADNLAASPTSPNMPPTPRASAEKHMDDTVDQHESQRKYYCLFWFCS